MSATFVWTISQLDCIPDVDGKQDYVVTAHWQCNGSEVSGDKTYTAQIYGTSSFQVDPGPNYIPYEDLTQDIVLGWVWASGISKDGTEASVQKMIDNQIDPPIISPPLPWAAPVVI
jgi:hypothetical protein